jgi:hypothetical protein
MIDAAKYVYDKVISQNVCPIGPSGTLVTQLLNTGNAMFRHVRSMVPRRDRFPHQLRRRETAHHRRTRQPCHSVPHRRGLFYDDLLLQNQNAAIEVIKYFTSAAMGKVFAEIRQQTPAKKGAYQ